MWYYIKIGFNDFFWKIEWFILNLILPKVNFENLTFFCKHIFSSSINNWCFNCLKAVFKASNSIFLKDVDYDRRGFQRNEVVYLNPYNTWPCKIPSQPGFEFLFWTETVNSDKKQHFFILCWPPTFMLTVIANSNIFCMFKNSVSKIRGLFNRFFHSGRMIYLK